MKFLLTTKSWISLFILSFFIVNESSVIAQTILPDLSKIKKNEKKLLQYKSIKEPNAPNRDKYLSYVNNLELEIDLRKKIKNQYIVLESELLKLNTLEEDEKEQEQEQEEIKVKTVRYNNLQADIYNAVLKDKVFEEKLKQSKKEFTIRAMYLNQILKANNNSTIKENITVQTEGNSQNSVDSIYAIVIKKITDQEDKIASLKASMKGAMDFLMDKTKVAKNAPQTNTSAAISKPVVNPLNQVTANVQNVLRQPQISNYNFRVNYAIDNKLMEDRKGFMPSPLLQGKRSIRYEEKVNGRKHDGVVFTSQAANVSNISQGTVVKVGQLTPSKKYIIIKHDGDYMTVYANLKEVYVSENQYIKHAGSIGQASQYKNGSYAIHFQIWKGSQSLNPSRWIKNN